MPKIVELTIRVPFRDSVTDEEAIFHSKNGLALRYMDKAKAKVILVDVLDLSAGWLRGHPEHSWKRNMF